MTNAWDWQGAVGDNWAIEWQRTDRSFAALNALLVDSIVAKASPTAQILDIGCGAGDTSLALAAHLPEASIKGIDLSPALIAAARERNGQGRIEFTQADATLWNGGEWHPDLLVSRHGVMFFDDPVAAFAHFAKVAAPDAQIVFSCFRDRSQNDWADRIVSLLPNAPVPAPDAPGPFAFANPDRVRDILAAAGWRNVTAKPVDCPYIAGGGEDPVTDAMDYFARIGPAAPVIRTLGREERFAFFDRLGQLLRSHLENGQVSFNAAAWIWSARL